MEAGNDLLKIVTAGPDIAAAGHIIVMRSLIIVLKRMEFAKIIITIAARSMDNILDGLNPVKKRIENVEYIINDLLKGMDGDNHLIYIPGRSPDTHIRSLDAYEHFSYPGVIIHYRIERLPYRNVFVYYRIDRLPYRNVLVFYLMELFYYRNVIACYRKERLFYRDVVFSYLHVIFFYFLIKRCKENRRSLLSLRHFPGEKGRGLFEKGRRLLYKGRRLFEKGQQLS